MGGAEQSEDQHPRRGASTAKHDRGRHAPRLPPSRSAASELGGRRSRLASRICNTFQLGGESPRTWHGRRGARG